MRINELKDYLGELIEAAYAVAQAEGHQEIMYPFTIIIHADGTVEYRAIGGRMGKGLAGGQGAVRR